MKFMPAASDFSNNSNVAIQVLIATFHRVGVFLIVFRCGDFPFHVAVRE